MTLKETILGANDRPVKPLEVPEWGCTVYLRPMSGLERDRWETAKVEGETASSPATWALSMVAATLCDEQGARVFSLEDTALLSGRNAAVVARLADCAIRVNGMGPDKQGAAEKNSATAPPAAS